MADFVSVTVKGVREVRAEMARIDRSTNRATMWAVRQAGRRVGQVARRNAPVYQGSRPDIPKGRLKRSIHSDRQLRRQGVGGYSVRVGPRGYPAQAYAPKQEARTPYMRPAYHSVVFGLDAIAADAWTRATRSRG